MLLHNPHKLSNKRLQMENDLRTHPNPMLIERRPLNDIRLKSIIDQRNKLEGQSLQNSCWRYAMREQVVEFRPDLQNSLWGVLFHDFVCDLADESFPVWGWDWSVVGDFLAVISLAFLQLADSW